MQAQISNRRATGLVLSVLWTIAAWGAPPSPASVTAPSRPATSGSSAKVSAKVSATSTQPSKTRLTHGASQRKGNNGAQKREAAKAALSPPKISQLRPTGPITVTANHAELVGGNEAIYVGNVKVRSNTVKMDGTRMEWRQKKSGQFIAHLTGHPAHLAHAATGPEDPAISARADTLIYDSANQILTLNGDAQLTRGANVVTGDTIRYDIAEKRVQAAGGHNGQVKMIIEPPPSKAPSTAAMPSTNGGGH